MRCFVAVEISEEIRKNALKMQENFRILGIKLVEPENLHFTLKFLGDVSDENLLKIREILSEIRKPIFDISVKGVFAFPNISHPRIIWLGCDSGELDELAKEISYKLASIGFPPEERYNSHITIARIKNLPKKNGLTRVISALEQLETIEIGKMEVGEFCIKQSILTPKKPVYRDIQKFVLYS